MKYHNCKVAKLGDSSVAVLIIALIISFRWMLQTEILVSRGHLSWYVLIALSRFNPVTLETPVPEICHIFSTITKLSYTLSKDPKNI